MGANVQLKGGQVTSKPQEGWTPESSQAALREAKEQLEGERQQRVSAFEFAKSYITKIGGPESEKFRELKTIHPSGIVRGLLEMLRADSAALQRKDALLREIDEREVISRSMSERIQKELSERAK